MKGLHELASKLDTGSTWTSSIKSVTCIMMAALDLLIIPMNVFGWFIHCLSPCLLNCDIGGVDVNKVQMQATIAVWNAPIPNLPFRRFIEMFLCCFQSTSGCLFQCSSSQTCGWDIVSGNLIFWRKSYSCNLLPSSSLQGGFSKILLTLGGRKIFPCLTAKTNFPLPHTGMDLTLLKPFALIQVPTCTDLKGS